MVVADAYDLGAVALRRPAHLRPNFRHSALHLHAILGEDALLLSGAITHK